MRRLGERRHQTVDALVAGVFLVGGVIEILLSSVREGPLGANLAAIGVVAAAAYMRRRAPLAAAAAFLVTIVVEAAFLTPPPDLVHPVAGLLVFGFAAGAYAPSLRSILVVPAFAVAIGAVNLLTGIGQVAADVLFLGVLTTASWLVGRAMAARARLAAELHEAAVQAEEGREAEAALAVAAERRRIAREMHDVIAHSISVMVVQAGGARRILATDQDRAVHAAAQIERTGRDALTEMRRLLGVLQPREGGAEREPQPGMHALDALVQRARDAGLSVTVEVTGEAQPLSAGMDLAAYRIVQEALTNVLKHAHAAPTEVTIRWTSDELEVRVRDRGPGPGAPGASGHGILGMGERARLYGGDFSAGPVADGGFEVRATLPLAAVRTPEEVPA